MATNHSFGSAVQMAKEDLIQATNNTMMKYQLPAFILEGVLSSVLSDIRAQCSIDLTHEIFELRQSLENEEIEHERENN